MTSEQIVSVCAKYDSILESKGFKAQRLVFYESHESHIRWMCQEIPNMITTGNLEKANRWLGFVQGTLWSKDMMTIDEMKNDNR